MSQGLPADAVPQPAVGQLLSAKTSCTASMVASRSGRVAVTAAHCVYTPQRSGRVTGLMAGREPGWSTDVRFVPGADGDRAPYGTWPVVRMWVDRAWQTNGDPEFDVAFLELADSPTGTAQEVLGALGVQFSESGTTTGSQAGPTVEILGYPVSSPDDRPRLRRCAESATDAASPDIFETECGLAMGSSGGPWIVGDGAFGRVVAVTSYASTQREGWLGSARLGSFAQELWNRADAAVID